MASAVAQNMAAGNTHHAHAAFAIAQQVQDWAGHLIHNASEKWVMSVLMPTECGSPDVSFGKPRACKQNSVVRCDVCGRACCLAHCRVDYMGDAICEVCIGEAKGRARANGTAPRQEPPKSGVGAASMSSEGALRMLKLAGSPSWDAIKKQYRVLVRRYNADRPQTDKQRAKNTELLKRFNAAYEVLRAKHEPTRREAA